VYAGLFTAAAVQQRASLYVVKGMLCCGVSGELLRAGCFQLNYVAGKEILSCALFAGVQQADNGQQS
jgi:hypothetical protein